MEYNEYGHYSADGTAYIITERRTPRNWYNYLYNDTYVGFLSQIGVGEGFCQDDLGTRIKLIMDRCLYVTDRQAGTWHTANGLPMSAHYDAYTCRHGLGYTTFSYEKDGLAGQLTVFVPAEGDFEQWIFTITNRRPTEADLGVIAYCATNTDGAYEAQGYTSMDGDWDSAAEAVCHRVSTSFRRRRPGVTYSYMMVDRPMTGYDSRKNAFIGVYGSKENPEAFEHGLGCTNSACVVEKLCFALETSLRLAPGAAETVCFQIGHVMEREEIAPMHRFLAPGMPQRLLDAVVAERTAACAGVKIKTPDEKLNLAFNSFYQYSTVMGAQWARVRHNGYRDMASDTECLASFNPELAWTRLMRILTYQYSTGYAPRTIKDGRIQDNHYIDCAMWLAATTHTLVMELGDPGLLLTEVNFNDGSSATVFEHIRRAMQYLYDAQGMHGLIKIWGGDWNDGMNWAGLGGRGVSVWLSIAWYRANKLFIELCGLLGERELAAKHAEMGETMRQRIEEYGWDGKYYITAINDDGKKIGSQESEACRMWLNPQIWAVMAGIAPKEKLEQIMAEVDDYLECPYGTRINRPAYTACDPTVGNFTRQPAGTLLNESVYLQPMTWKITADAILGRRAQMQASLEKLLPWNHKHAVTYGEPYILYNFYYPDEHCYRVGTPGQSWRTATAHSLVRTIIRYLYGLEPTIEGLHIRPCLPPDWQTCSITKQFRGCTYDITYRQQSPDGRVTVTVDGTPLDGDLLPCRPGERLRVEVVC